MKRIFFFWSGVLVFWLNYGCGPNGTSDAGKTVFRYNDASGIFTLDPAFAKDQSHNWICQQLYSGLVELDSQLVVKPAVASSWTVSDDGKTYFFTLRDDVYFTGSKSDKPFSRKVVSADFVFSLNRLTDPKVASPGAWVMASVKKDPEGKTVGIQAINDSTLRIELDHPFPAFLSLLAMPYCSVVPHEIVDAYGQDFRSHPCGTGPFRLAYWKEGVRMVLHRNENYYEHPLPYLDAVEVHFMADKQSAFLEFLKGDLDFLSGLDASYKDQLLTASGSLQPRYRGKFQLQTMPYLNTEYLGILMDPSVSLVAASPLKDVRVRKALSMGFDRKAMMLYLRNDMGTPGIYGFVPPGLSAAATDGSTGYSYDPVRARSLLSEAGYPDGKGMPEIVLSTTSSYLDLCEFIKSQWEALGLKVKIDVNQAAVHRKMVAEQKLVFFRGSWIADYPDPENYLSLFVTRNAAPAGPNYTHYSNPTADVLYDESQRCTDPLVRDSLYRKMDRLIMDDAPVIILYYDKVLRLVSNSIDGLPPNAMNQLVLKHVRKNPAD